MQNTPASMLSRIRLSIFDFEPIFAALSKASRNVVFGSCAAAGVASRKAETRERSARIGRRAMA